MSVHFKVVERPNPRDLTLPNKYYAHIVNGDDITFAELAQLISKVSNLNYGSVVGTLATLVEVIELQLIHGRQVRLSDLGTLYLTLSSEGVDSKDGFSAANIKKAAIRFRPGQRLKALVRNLKFAKLGNNGTTAEEDEIDA
ncbi:MAG: HU family DNA-binding protein [Marinoscillum sp.]|uniref:HU family DNA-binding protein n=1 Tax=Marinoscillum sp. TaxID=2024838 RepID=UPI0032F8A0F7